MQDYRLDGSTSLRILLALSLARNAMCFVAPVVAEVGRKHESELSKLKENIRGASRLIGGNSAAMFEKALAEAKTVSGWFYRYSLAQFEPCIRGFPDVPHEVVVKRLHERRKPFGGSTDKPDVGYRDFLIWCSVLELLIASPDSGVAFVTDNHRDFFAGPKEPELHEDLVQDLVDYEIDLSRVVCFRSRQDYLEGLLMQLSDAARNLLGRSPSWFRLLEREWAPSAMNALWNKSSRQWTGEPGPRIWAIDEVEFRFDKVEMQVGEFLVSGAAEFNPRWHFGDNRPGRDNSNTCGLKVLLDRDMRPKAVWVDDGHIDVSDLGLSAG